MLFNGDWRQIPTVVPHDTRIDNCRQVSEKLIPVALCCHPSTNYEWELLRLLKSNKTNHIPVDHGDGKIPVDPQGGEFAIEIPDSLTRADKTLQDIVSWVYEDIYSNIAHPKWLCDRNNVSNQCWSGQSDKYIPRRRACVQQRELSRIRRSPSIPTWVSQYTLYTSIHQILPHLLVVKSLVGVNAGCTLLIPRITIIPSDSLLPFTFRRR